MTEIAHDGTRANDCFSARGDGRPNLLCNANEFLETAQRPKTWDQALGYLGNMLMSSCAVRKFS